MITLLEDVLMRADGAYVNAQDLILLDGALLNWQVRKEAYNSVQEKELEIINQAVTLMREGNRFETKPLDNPGVDRCRRDMILGLRSCALAMLLQDGELLKDRVLYWQQNIFLAMQLNYQGYKCLDEAIKVLLTAKESELMRPYLKMAHEMMSGK
jgi:hypothetical protein